jgi:hypothetical protein
MQHIRRPPPDFRDLSEPSGLSTFVHSDGGSGKKYFVEQMGSGVALLDFDGDGWLDVYFCSGTPLPGFKRTPGYNHLFRNLGNGKFEDVTLKAGVACRKYSIGAAAADFDNDGRVDLYVCCFGANVLYRNRGDGTFEDVTAKARVGDPRLSSSAAWGDYDADGYLDLYVANYAKFRLEDDLWCSRTSGKKSFCSPTMYEPEVHSLYRNNRDGTFTDVSESAGIRKATGNGLGVIWLDYDDDGRPDIFVADDQSPNLLWHNQGDGTFVDRAGEAGTAFGEEGNARAGMGVDSGDYNNDGKPDIVVTNFSEEPNALYHGDGGGIFRDLSYPAGIGASTTMFLGFGTGFLDFDRDGWQDLFFANGHVLDDIADFSDSVTWAQSAQLFRNRRDGSFEDISKITSIANGKRVARGAAFGDLDNDGRVDIVVSSIRDKALYLHNEASAGAHWLGLDLRAGTGKAQAIGARVALTAGENTQHREVRAGNSYASSSDPRLVFGLGTETQVREVVIRWRSGKTSRLANPSIDRYIRVVEAEQPAAEPAASGKRTEP